MSDRYWIVVSAAGVPLRVFRKEELARSALADCEYHDEIRDVLQTERLGPFQLVETAPVQRQSEGKR